MATPRFASRSMPSPAAPTPPPSPLLTTFPGQMFFPPSTPFISFDELSLFPWTPVDCSQGDFSIVFLAHPVAGCDGVWVQVPGGRAPGDRAPGGRAPGGPVQSSTSLCTCLMCVLLCLTLAVWVNVMTAGAQ